MNREDLLNKIMTLETNMERLQKDFIELKQLSVQLVEENVSLQMERDALKHMIEPEKTPTKRRVNSKENLAQLYAEGFHICGGSSGLFGKHRNGEDCMFCLQVLNND